MEVKLLAKNKSENRLKIRRNQNLVISLISSQDLQLQEYDIMMILNLSLCDKNKEDIASLGATKPLVRALTTRTPAAKENAVCTLLRLLQVEENKVTIRRCGVIPLLVNLLEIGGFHGKNDVSMALYSPCSVKENKIKAVRLSVLVAVAVAEARAVLVDEGGIPIEVGMQRQKEIAVVSRWGRERARKKLLVHC